MKHLLLFFCTAMAVASHAQINALSLDGTGQYVTIPDNDALDMTTSITLEMWVKLNSIGANQQQILIDKANDETSNYRLLLYNSTGMDGNTVLSFWNSVNSAEISTARIINGQWTHVAVTITGGTLSFYVNGVLTNTTPYTLGVANSFPLTLGKHTVETIRNFDGQMDEIRIWNVARTTAEIKAYTYTPPNINSPGLVAYYRCNDAGTTLTNVAGATGAAIDGTLPAGGSFVASPILYSGNALAMQSNLNNFLLLGPVLPSTSSYTKEAWVYITDPSVVNNIVSSTSSPFFVGGTLKAGNNGSTPTVEDPDDFVANTWTHVAVTWDANTFQFILYKNGLQVAAAGDVQGYMGESIYIGAYYNGSSTEAYLGGIIDEVRIWNSVRTQSEIQNNMDAEVSPFAELGLVAYYTFDQGIASGDNTGIFVAPDSRGNSNGLMSNFDMTGSTSNFVAQKDGFAILPVTWLSFTAQEYQQQVLLKWSTAAEHENAAFMVQHSTDGINYTDIATLPSHGNGTTVQQYRYTHSNPSAGVNYYRIKQRDYSGAVSFSATNTVRVGEKVIDFAVLNTVVQNGVLQVQVFRPVTLQVTNSNGSLVYKKQLSKGNHNIDVSAIAKGANFVSSGNQVMKIIVQ